MNEQITKKSVLFRYLSDLDTDLEELYQLQNDYRFNGKNKNQAIKTAIKIAAAYIRKKRMLKEMQQLKKKDDNWSFQQALENKISLDLNVHFSRY